MGGARAIIAGGAAERGRRCAAAPGVLRRLRMGQNGAEEDAGMARRGETAMQERAMQGRLPGGGDRVQRADGRPWARRRSPLVTLATLLLVAAAAAGAETAPAAAEAPPALVLAEGVVPHAGVDAIYHRFAAGYDRLDAAAVADLYTPDALYLAPGNEVMRGRAAIGDSFAGFFGAVRAQGGRLAIRFEVLDRVVAPGMVGDVGHFLLSRPGGGGGGMRGKFSVVARQGDDGAWRFHVDSYSGVDEAPAAAADPAAAGLSPEERAAAAASLLAAESAFADAFARRDRDAFFAAVAPDAVFLAPERALVGKAEVEAEWGGFFEPAEAPFSWRPVRAEPSPDGALGLTNGPVYDPAGQWIGSFQSIWRRQPDGSWRVIFDGAPSCRPPAEPAAPAS